jgi:hypothetical protein
MPKKSRGLGDMVRLVLAWMQIQSALHGAEVEQEEYLGKPTEMGIKDDIFVLEF